MSRYAFDSRTSPAIPFSPNPFSDAERALPETPHMSDSHAGIQRPPRTQQRTYQAQKPWSYPYSSHSRQTTDMSRRTRYPLEPTESRFGQKLTSRTMLCSAALLGQLSLLSIVAALAIQTRNFSLEMATSAGIFLWMTVSLVIGGICAVAAILIYKERQKCTLAKLRRVSSLDSQFGLIQSLNNYRRESGQYNLDSISEGRLPDPRSFEIPSPRSTQQMNVGGAIQNESPLRTANPVNVWTERNVVNLPRQQSRGGGNQQVYDDNNNASAGPARKISIENTAPYGMICADAVHDDGSKALPPPPVLFRTPLVPLPKHASRTPGQLPAHFYPAKPYGLVDKPSPQESTLDLEAAFSPGNTARPLDACERQHASRSETLEHNDFASPPPGLEQHNPFGSSEAAMSSSGYASSQFFIGSSDTSSPVEVEQPRTPPGNLHLFSVSPSYSHRPKDSDGHRNGRSDPFSPQCERDDTPSRLHGRTDSPSCLEGRADSIMLHAVSPLRVSRTSFIEDQALYSLNQEERRAYFEQQRRAFSSQNEFVYRQSTEEDSNVFDEIFDDVDSTGGSARGKDKETGARSQSVLLGYGGGNPTNPFSPFLNQGPFSQGPVSREELAERESALLTLSTHHQEPGQDDPKLLSRSHTIWGHSRRSRTGRSSERTVMTGTLKTLELPQRQGSITHPRITPGSPGAEYSYQSRNPEADLFCPRRGPELSHKKTLYPPDPGERAPGR